MKKLTTGDRMKDRRKFMGISVAEISEYLGINSKTYYRYEDNSIRKIPADVIIKVAKVLECTPEFLAGHELEEDKELKSLFLQLSEEDREKIIRQMKNMIKKYSVPFFKAAREKKEAEKKAAEKKTVQSVEDANFENAESVTDIDDL